jgi:predicted amidohydrolase
MSRTLKIGVVQMDAAPAPLDDRLARAADLVAEAAASGAELIVLPELFNSGYVYDDSNYTRAETYSGPTATWLRGQAESHGVHLAGTFLLLDGDEVYNTALLVAPDGRTWRYDKNYPFLWERAYFREGRGITIANTDLGKLGLMICWDAAHPQMWARYAGQVDAMLILSSPPKLSSADVVFPDGYRQNIRELTPDWYVEEELFTGVDMNRQAAWLNVPVAATVAGGAFRSRLPQPFPSLLFYILRRPDLWKRILQARKVELETGYDQQTKVITPDGGVATRVTVDGDGVALAEVPLADSPPEPNGPQPKMLTPGIAHLMADTVGPFLLIGRYRRMQRKTHGAHMAPPDGRTRIWTLLVIAAGILGWLAGKLGV